VKRRRTDPAPDPDAVDLADVDRIIAEKGAARSAAIPILQALQARFRYLPTEALERVCDRTEITRAQIAEVATFYAQFRLKPIGRHLVKVCHGTACHVAGAPQITDAIRRSLGIEAEEEDTDAKRQFTVAKVACLGCCSLAPCLMIDDVTYGRLTPRTAPLALKRFLADYGD
jgi:NADH:ubiquinone oxidoreductase subunit E